MNDSVSISTLFLVTAVIAVAIVLTQWTGPWLWPLILPVAGAVTLGTAYSLLKLEPGVETGTGLGSVLGAMVGCLSYGPFGFVLFLPAALVGFWCSRYLLPFESLKRH